MSQFTVYRIQTGRFFCCQLFPMSRIGKLPIKIPAGTEVSVISSELIVKGKGGTLRRAIHPAGSVSVDSSTVTVTPVKNNRLARALWGTDAAHVRNMISGVTQPFTKNLMVGGIGYQAELPGKRLKLSVGFSHPVLVTVPEGIAVSVD